MRYRFRLTSFRGCICYIHEGRIEGAKPKHLEKWNMYNIRHSDNDWFKPHSIEIHVVCNFWGYILLPPIFELKMSGEVDDYELVLTPREANAFVKLCR